MIDKKFSISKILQFKTPDLLWSIAGLLKKEAAENHLELDTDGKNYIYLNTGSDIMFVAHMDTVNSEGNGPVELYVNDRGYIQNKHGVLGADDRAGVWAILEIYRRHRLYMTTPDVTHKDLKSFYDDYRGKIGGNDKLPALLFTNFEESGGKGVKEFTTKYPELTTEYKMFIELDRRGKDHYVTYNGALPAEITKFLTERGLKDEHGSYSDICDLTRKYKVPSINLACGYYGQHGASEMLDLGTLERAVRKCLEIYTLRDTIPKLEVVEKTYTGSWNSNNNWNDDGYYDNWYGGGHSRHHMGSGCGVHRHTNNNGNGTGKTVTTDQPECPVCQHKDSKVLRQEYDTKSGGMKSRRSCNVCTHQWLAPIYEVVKTDKPGAKANPDNKGKAANNEPEGIWVPANKVCTCKSTQFDKSFITDSKGTRAYYKCKECFKTNPGDYVTLKTESICKTCGTRTVMVDEACTYAIRESTNMHVTLKCELCGGTTSRKVNQDDYNTLYKGFNSRMRTLMSMTPSKRVVCTKCGKNTAYTTVAGITQCYACKEEVSDTKAADKTEIISVSEMGSAVKLAADAISRDLTLTDYQAKREKVKAALKQVCVLCTNHANCDKAGKEYVPRYFATVCPVIKAGDFVITGAEIFLETQMNDKPGSSATA